MPNCLAVHSFHLVTTSSSGLAEGGNESSACKWSGVSRNRCGHQRNFCCRSRRCRTRVRPFPRGRVLMVMKYVSFGSIDRQWNFVRRRTHGRGSYGMAFRFRNHEHRGARWTRASCRSATTAPKVELVALRPVAPRSAANRPNAGPHSKCHEPPGTARWTRASCRSATTATSTQCPGVMAVRAVTVRGFLATVRAIFASVQHSSIPAHLRRVWRWWPLHNY